jgi:SAM-dependent methyltransferase
MPSPNSHDGSNNCYDYPEYWDLAFRDETQLEADFFEAAFKRFAERPVKRLLEPGCGGGRLVVEMARRGFESTGFDISESAIDYLRKRLGEQGLSAEVYVDDMTNFQVAQPVDAIFNTFNTFRHMLDEQSSLSHLQAVARALAPGGLFILGLHIIPPDADDEDEESWPAEEDSVHVTVDMQILETDWTERQEVLRFDLHVKDGAKEIELSTDYTLRLYRVEQIRSLLAKVPELEICGIYDFWYDLDEPQTLDEETSDTVLVFRRT